MPIYEYVCMHCEAHFEELVRNGDAVSCPECAGTNVRKQLSVFTAHGSSALPSFGETPRSGGCCGGGCGCG
jgi:putative FmdB family regulatory protein